MKFNIIRPLIATALLMLLPLAGRLFLPDWNWGPLDYVFAAIMVFGTASLFELGRILNNNNLYRAGFGMALVAGFILIWGNLAVGLIGSEDNPANLMYLVVLAIAFLGAIMARFQPRGLSRTMFATAAAIAIIPVIALITKSNFQDVPEAVGVAGVFALNTLFVVLFIGSGLLFHQSRTPATNQIAE